MFDKMLERRGIYRWQLNRQAKIKLAGAQNFANCYIKDLNFKGLQICLGLRLLKDTFLKFNLCLSEDCALDIEAWVVWQRCIMQANNYGLYFTKIKDYDKEKIYKFVQTYCANQVVRQYRQDIKDKGGEIMQGVGLEDKRIFARFQAILPMRFLDPKSNREGKGQTLDISAKGIGLVASEELACKTSLELWLEIPDKGGPLYSRGTVVWTKMVGPNKCRLGVNLEKADMMGLSRVMRTK